MLRDRIAPSAWAAPVPRLAGLALAGAALFLAGCAALGAPNPPRTITVTGLGTAYIPPDLVTISLGVQTRGSDIGQVVQENNAAAEAVMAAVREMGVAEDDIQTTYFNVSTQPRYDEFGNPTDEVTYWVDNTLQVSLRDISRLGDLLDSALSAGANSVQGLSYNVEDPEAALSGARAQALEDGRRQAEQLAAGAGASLGPVYSLTESFSGGSPYPTYFEKRTAAEVPTVPGTLEYQVQVYLTYTLR